MIEIHITYGFISVEFSRSHLNYIVQRLPTAPNPELSIWTVACGKRITFKCFPARDVRCALDVDHLHKLCEKGVVLVKSEIKRYVHDAAQSCLS